MDFISTNRWIEYRTKEIRVDKSMYVSLKCDIEVHMKDGISLFGGKVPWNSFSSLRK